MVGKYSGFVVAVAAMFGIFEVVNLLLEVDLSQHFTQGSEWMNRTGLRTERDVPECAVISVSSAPKAPTVTSSSTAHYYKQYSEPSPFPNEFDGVWARAYNPWPQNTTIPCLPMEENFPQHDNSPTDTGLFFVKPYKTGSSSAAGINIRLARGLARKLGKDYEFCKTRFDHSRVNQAFPSRDKKRSFAWSIIRDPTSRLVSQFFHFEVSRNKVEPSDDEFRRFLFSKSSDMIQDHYLSFLSDDVYRSESSNPADTANKILEDMDFIGITERMDESAVALSMLLNVSMSEVLFLKAKGHGGYDAGGGREGNKCTYIWPSFETTGMKEIFETDEFQALVRWDYVLYQAANRSLDMTIEKLGRENFEKQLVQYRYARMMAQEKCLPDAVFPCSEGGRFVPPEQTTCVWKDSACSMDCLDQVGIEQNL